MLLMPAVLEKRNISTTYGLVEKYTRSLNIKDAYLCKDAIKIVKKSSLN